MELESINKVKEFLDKEGVKTSRKKNFSKQSIADILQNKFYKGIIEHSDIIKEGSHRPLINRITFGKVQAMLCRNNKNKSDIINIT